MKISAVALAFVGTVSGQTIPSVQLGPRPFWLVSQMRDGDLKDEMKSCIDSIDQYAVSDFSIGHRGAPLQIPEHTLEGYEAAARLGAGIIECDVTFTKDRELVCRHSQCDLHTTTNVVTIPELNAKCSTPWSPGVAPNCCTSDFTLEEIKTLCAKMDSSNDVNAETAEGYAYGGTAAWRTDLYAQPTCPRVPTHAESIELINSFGAYFTPELKSASVEMPYEGNYTQEDYAMQMIQDYIDAGIPPSKVWPQSFNHDDVKFWVANTDFGDQAVALDGNDGFTQDEVEAMIADLVSSGVKIVAPPMQRLVESAPDTELLIQPSAYAISAKEAGLDIIAWSLERTGPGLTGYYWDTLDNGDVDIVEGDRLTLLEVLAQDVGVLGVFSDWPATTSFYANCRGVSLRNEPTYFSSSDDSYSVQLGPRPYWLIGQMRDGTLKDELAECAATIDSFEVSDFSIGHRGAPLQIPEHTLEGYEAAARLGAGIIECDVTFTKDRELVCRHSQCDLHTTTNVVTIPELNAKCSTPWSPGVAPNCCTSDFTLEEIKTLCAKMDSSNDVDAETAEGYAYGGTAAWRTDLYAQPTCPRVPTHAESIELINSFGAYFTPELKSASVEMPYEGNYTQEDYAMQMIQDYIDAGIPPSKVWPQSFNHDDVKFWVANTDFGDQAVALDGNDGFTQDEVEAMIADLVSSGVKIVAPPMQRLVESAPDTELLIQPSAYAIAAKEAGLDIIAWSLERTGPGLTGYYWDTLDNGDVDIVEGDRLTLLEVLAQDVGVLGVFSDWPATTSFYANCKNVGLRGGGEVETSFPTSSPAVNGPTDAPAPSTSGSVASVQLGPRPFWLVSQMRDGDLKDEMMSCIESIDQYSVSDFSIGHRGAPLQIPEHTLEGYEAAARLGAGIIECDVTFTKDRELVCRHSQCDLHTTTNVVTIPELNAKCSTPWSPGVAPNCCTSDFTLEEIKTLCAKMDSSNDVDAETAEGYVYGGTAAWRTDLYAQPTCSRVPTHAESIELINSFGAYFTPELKSASVEMPYEGNYTQEDYAMQMIQDYIDAGIPPSKVWPQSFNHDDVKFWVANTDFGDQAVALDGNDGFTQDEVEAMIADLVSSGVKIVAPPMQRLVESAPDTELLIQPSAYAIAAKEAGLDIIAWSLERTGPGLTGYYWDTLDNGDVDIVEGDRLTLLEVLAQDVGVLGVFSDWPATTSFYANCRGVSLRNEPTYFSSGDDNHSVQLGPRPYWLIGQMRDGTLKDELAECAATIDSFEVSDFSIGHRGAPLQIPEHTLEGYEAAARLGAGIIECDVTFTKDLELVCRHSQCDLHTTTNVVTIPELNAKCSTPWSPGVSPRCCTSDFTLEEIKTLCAKMDSSNDVDAETAEGYAYGGTSAWRTELYAQSTCPRVPTHAESIELINSFGAYFTPELKSASVDMPFEGNYTQEDYAMQMIQDYIDAGIPPSKVWPQSFNHDDVKFWVANTDFGDQAVALDGNGGLTQDEVEAMIADLVSSGVKIVAPPMQRLVESAPDTELLIQPSAYAIAAKEAGLDIIAWSMERTGPGLSGSYWSSVNTGDFEVVEGDRFTIIEALAQEVGVLGIFSDWPASTTFYANCKNIGLRESDDVATLFPTISPAVNGPTVSPAPTPDDDSAASFASWFVIWFMALLAPMPW